MEHPGRRSLFCWCYAQGKVEASRGRESGGYLYFAVCWARATGPELRDGHAAGAEPRVRFAVGPSSARGYLPGSRGPAYPPRMSELVGSATHTDHPLSLRPRPLHCSAVLQPLRGKNSTSPTRTCLSPQETAAAWGGIGTPPAAMRNTERSARGQVAASSPDRERAAILRLSLAESPRVTT